MTDSRQPVVISGVTRGLGQALARRFAALGHPVAGCGRGADTLGEPASERGDGHRFERADVTDAEWVDARAERVHCEPGVPGPVVADAGAITAQAPGVGGAARGLRHGDPRERGRRVREDVSAAHRGRRHARHRLVGLGAQPPGAARRVHREQAPGGGPGTAMLATCLPDEHHTCPSADEWAKTAVGHLLHRLPAQSDATELTVNRGTHMKNTRVVVTGAARDFGRTLAVRFAALGAEVYLSARSLEAAQATRDEIVALGYDKVHA
ncbi:hypothetical protein ACFC0P_43695, partial [Streptomyces broussonetiae]